MTRILVVEDDLDLSEMLTYCLQLEQYKVTAVYDGLQAMDEFDKNGTDLILLDLGLPGLPGTEVCRRIRAKSDVPIVIITGRGLEADAVLGFELGADDYVTKPYSARVLVSRIRAVLRRTQEKVVELEPVISAGTVEMDLNRHAVTVSGVEVSMPLKEYELLECLIRNAGFVMTRAQLIEQVWGADYFGDTKTLDVHIKRLRKRVEVNASAPLMLITVRGYGYRFEQRVSPPVIVSEPFDETLGTNSDPSLDPDSTLWNLGVQVPATVGLAYSK